MRNKLLLLLLSLRPRLLEKGQSYGNVEGTRWRITVFWLGKIRTFYIQNKGSI